MNTGFDNKPKNPIIISPKNLKISYRYRSLKITISLMISESWHDYCSKLLLVG